MGAWTNFKESIQTNIALMFVASLSSAVPVLHESIFPAHQASCGLGNHLTTLTSLADANVAIAAKIALAIVAFLAVMVCLKPKRSTGIVAFFASIPILKTMVLAAAIIGAGLAAFDCCTAFHGASVDVTGSCHCWLTGILAASGAMVVAIFGACGRVIRTLVTDVIRTISAFFIWIVRLFTSPHIHLYKFTHKLFINLFDLRRLHGRRGPPALAMYNS